MAPCESFGTGRNIHTLKLFIGKIKILKEISVNTESEKIKRLSPYAQTVVRTTRNYFKKSKPLSEVIPPTVVRTTRNYFKKSEPLSEVIPPIFPSYFDDHEPGADGLVHSQFKKEIVHG